MATMNERITTSNQEFLAVKYKIYKSNYVKIVYNVYMLIVEIGVFYMKKVLEILEVVVTLSLLTKLIYFINYYDNLI